jgi:hypothetical protein
MSRRDDDWDDRADEDDYDDEDEDDYDDEDETGIEVSAGFFPLSWVLLFCRPHIVINRRKYVRSWGRHFFPVRPGKYRVEISFPYLFSSKFGLRSVKARVYPGERTRVEYYVWGFMFIPPSIRVLD